MVMGYVSSLSLRLSKRVTWTYDELVKSCNKLNRPVGACGDLLSCGLAKLWEKNMTRSKAMLISVAGLMLASGVAIAQVNDLVARTAGPDKEVRIAQQALADAIVHLQKVRDPKSQKNAHILDLVERAQSELRYEDGSGPAN
jgi:hypothetical protein